MSKCCIAKPYSALRSLLNRVTNLENSHLYPYPVGSVYCTSDPEVSPAALFGGEWELYDKMFMSQYISEGFFIPAEGTTISSIAAILTDHVVRFRITLSYATDLSDTNTVLGTVDWGKLGITVGNTATSYFIGSSDSGNGASLGTLNYESGVITHTETLGENRTIIADSQITYNFVINSLTVRMLNNFCDKFMWRRIK